MIRTIVVDDEPEAREGISALISEVEGLKIVASCRNGIEAIESINQCKPDLLLLDIQMPEINGFEVLNSIENSVPYVIFATAYDEYAIKAFEHHAQDYLLKPFTDQRFFDAIARAIAFFEGSNELNTKQLTHLIEAYRKEKITISDLGEVIVRNNPEWNRLVIKTSGKIRFIDLSEIELIEAYENYVKVYVRDKFHLVRESMKSMELKLKNKRFVRVHKSYILNMHHASELSHKMKGDYELILTSGRVISVSRNYVANLKEYL